MGFPFDCKTKLKELEAFLLKMIKDIHASAKKQDCKASRYREKKTEGVAGVRGVQSRSPLSSAYNSDIFFKINLRHDLLT